LIAGHRFIIARRAILRHCWPLLAALLATFAHAQTSSPIRPNCGTNNSIEFDGNHETGSALAQETTNTPPAHSVATANPWVFSLTTLGYIVPGGQSYVSPDFTADRGTLHFEGRYNNEALRTASLWAGYNFSAGKKLVLNVTPMIGGVFGSLNGVAPGYLFTLTYKRVQLYSNGELVFDTQNRGRSYFYNWNQGTYSPLRWLQLGLVTQRTRTYHTSLNIQRGVLVGVIYKKVNFTTNIFNFGWTTPTEVLALGFNF